MVLIISRIKCQSLHLTFIISLHLHSSLRLIFSPPLTEMVTEPQNGYAASCSVYRESRWSVVVLGLARGQSKIILK